MRILKENNIDFEVIEYLKTPPSINELEGILKILNLKPKDIVRKREKEFVENNLSQIQNNYNKMLEAIVQFPKIMERPIIINNEHGVIGRPPEKILDII